MTVRAAPSSLSVVIAIGGILIAFALTYRLGSPPLFEDPNDGQYAEVAREMFASGDWVTPTLNDVVFLNKPPLLYWLTASSYALLGVNEAAARLPGVLTTVVALLLLYGLGCELFGSVTALLGVLAYAGMPGTLLEARFVRPDALLTASTIGALWAFAVAARREGREQRRALYALQAALAVGLLAKGIVALLLPGFPIFVILVVERRRDLLAAFASPRSWWLFAAVVIPWHVLAALRHEGFAWDYIVNQHFLFFLDAKEPRDSIPISLGTFWAAFLGRTFPWTIFLPLALAHAAGPLASNRRDDLGRVLVLAWVVGVLAFFSAATSRLEHYVLPALPGVALIVARLFEAGARQDSIWRRLLTVHLAVLAVVFVVAIAGIPAVLRQVDSLRGFDDLSDIARSVFLALSLAATLSLLVSLRDPRRAVAILSMAVLATFPLLHRALAVIAPMNSSAPVAAVVKEASRGEPAEIVFEAPTEYQHVAGLDFYLGHRVTLLRPPGFIEPPYLVPHREELFIERPELERLWRERRVIFVSDPLVTENREPAEIAPSPVFVIARVANRWVLTNRLERKRGQSP